MPLPGFPRTPFLPRRTVGWCPWGSLVFSSISFLSGCARCFLFSALNVPHLLDLVSCFELAGGGGRIHPASGFVCHVRGTLLPWGARTRGLCVCPPPGEAGGTPALGSPAEVLPVSQSRSLSAGVFPVLRHIRIFLKIFCDVLTTHLPSFGCKSLVFKTG